MAATINGRVTLFTEVRYHGKRPIDGSKSKPVAASRLAKALGASGDKKAKHSDDVASETDFTRSAKPYGEHDGTKQVAVLFNGEVIDPKETYKSISAAINEVEGQVSDDIPARKIQYTLHCNEVLKDHPGFVDAETQMRLHNKCAEQGFPHYLTQVKSILWSNEPFDGAQRDEKRNLYVRTSTSKGWKTLREPYAILNTVKRAYAEGRSSVTSKRVSRPGGKPAKVVQDSNGNWHLDPTESN